MLRDGDVAAKSQTLSRSISYTESVLAGFRSRNRVCADSARRGRNGDEIRWVVRLEAYARSCLFLEGAKIESSGNSVTTLRRRASNPRPPMMVSMAAPLPKPTKALFRNPLLDTPPSPSVFLAMFVLRSMRVLRDII